jgi:hypothetical protein
MNGDEGGVHDGGGSFSPSSTAVVQLMSNLIIRPGTSGKGAEVKAWAVMGARCLVK